MVSGLTKVALITPDWSRKTSYLPTDTTRPPKNFPLEWGYLTSSSHPGIEYCILDFYRFPNLELELAGVKLCIVSTTPSYLFWRCPPLSFNEVAATVISLRSGGFSGDIWLVGPHGTISPSETLKRTGASAVFRGEIDVQLSAAIIQWIEGRPNQFVCFDGGDSQIAPEEPLGLCAYPTDVAENSEPHLWIPLGQDRIKGKYIGGALLETSRGCSYDCNYCLRYGFRKTLRLKDAGLVEHEVAQLSSLGIKYVYLIDETFGIPPSHAQVVMEILKSYGMAYGVQTRPDIWNLDRVSRLVSSGCVYCEVGTESLTEKGIASLGKFQSSRIAIKKTELLKNSIGIVGVNIVDIGNPDLGLMAPTDALLERDNEGRLPPAFIPYPGTILGEKALSSLGLKDTWLDAEKAYFTYLLMSKKSILSYLLRRSLRLRRIVVKGAGWWSRVIGGRSTRHERNQ